MNILVSLTPSESKRLIAKALVIHPFVQNSLKNGNILISSGTTTGFFIQELLQIPFDIEKFPSGVVTQGLLCQTPDNRIRSIMLRKGQRAPENPAISDYDELDLFVNELGGDDIYIKGANAIDREGNAGFLLAHSNGGNVLCAAPKIYAQGIHFIIPVGLEKLIASVPEAQRAMKGINQYDYTFGRGCGYTTFNNGIIIHEIAAIELLIGAKGTHVGSGGIGGSEGATIFVIDGSSAQIGETIKLLNEIKGEPPVAAWKKKCRDCTYRCKYRFKHKQ